MPENRGTIEDITSGLLKVLEPLKKEVQPENILPFLASLGLSFPEALKSKPGITGAVSFIVSLTNELPGMITDLNTAIENKNYSKIAELVGKCVDLIKRAVTVFEQLSDEIHNVSADFAEVVASEVQAFATELPGKLFSWLVVTYLEDYQPLWLRVLNLLGIVQIEDIAGDDTIFGKTSYPLKTIRFDAFEKLFKDPAAHFSELYRWGKPDFDGVALLKQIAAWANTFFLPAKADFKAAVPSIKFPVGTLSPLVTGPDKGLQLLIEADWLKQFSFEMPFFFDHTFFKIDIRSEIEAAAKLLLLMGGRIEFVPPSGDIKGDLELSVKKVPSTAGQPIFIFGQPNATRFTAQSITAGMGLSAKWNGTKATGDYRFFFKLEKGEVVISLGGSDGFISQLAPSELVLNTDLVLGYSGSEGFYFEGSGGIEIKLPLHISIGPVDIEGLTISLKIADGLALESGATIKAALGPLNVVVENIGLKVNVGFNGDNRGNLGPVDLSLGFKPPNGVGLSINAGAVIGGGYLFFDFEKEEYAGVLELTIAGFISAKAIGLVTTKMPDGSKGFSMLIIITAEFLPPFQLGYGFTLNAVGGLLGLNRTMLLDPLRNAVRTGAVNSIMFPQNVIANAPRIISDLKAIFPPYEGKFLIGPMGKIGWGTPTLITLSLGIIIEIPGNIAILGVLKVALPTEQVPLVQIQVLFVGTIDFDKKMLTFDASLYESFVLAMTLEGDMAVRLKWGDNPDFLLSVGGFHPSYTPPPLSLPTMKRLAINILNTDIALIRVECYQAVTSNTVQFGAKAEIKFDLSVCAIEGYISFDALFQFNPFYFIIEVSASFKLSAAGIDILSVRVRMSLEGPTPWRARGTGSVTILFFEISADFDVTWGDEKNTSIPEAAIYQQFIDDLQKRECWSTVLSSNKNLLVSLRKIEDLPTAPLVLHPAGSLVVQQKMLPLQVKIDKVGSKKVSDVQKITIAKATSSGVNLKLTDVNEDFARAQYQNLSDAEKLSKPSFEKMPGGVQISLSGVTINNGKFVRKNVEYEITIIDKEPVKPFKKGKLFAQIGILFSHFLKGNSVAKSPLSKSSTGKLQPFADKMEVKAEGYTVAFQANNKAHTANATFGSEMMAQTYMQEQIAQQPGLKKELHIIPNYELQTS